MSLVLDGGPPNQVIDTQVDGGFVGSEQTDAHDAGGPLMALTGETTDGGAPNTTVFDGSLDGEGVSDPGTGTVDGGSPVFIEGATATGTVDLLLPLGSRSLEVELASGTTPLDLSPSSWEVPVAGGLGTVGVDLSPSAIGASVLTATGSVGVHIGFISGTALGVRLRDVTGSLVDRQRYTVGLKPQRVTGRLL